MLRVVQPRAGNVAHLHVYSANAGSHSCFRSAAMHRMRTRMQIDGRAMHLYIPTEGSIRTASLSFSFEMNRSEKYSNSPPGQSRNRPAYLRPRIVPKFVDFSMLLEFPLWGAPLGKEKTVSPKKRERESVRFSQRKMKFNTNPIGINRGWIRIEG